LRRYRPEGGWEKEEGLREARRLVEEVDGEEGKPASWWFGFEIGFWVGYLASVECGVEDTAA
jgi:hypothetical protein